MVGELNATFDRGPWSAFWGVNFIGKTSNHDRFGGNSILFLDGTARVRLKTEQVIYHSASLTRELPNGFKVRGGVSNIFDEAPPRVSTGNLGEYNIIGQTPFESQYDWLGRSFFMSVSKTF